MTHKLNSFKTTSEFYDVAVNGVLSSQINRYASRRDNLAALSQFLYVEDLIAQRCGSGSACFLDLCCGTGVCSIYPAKLGYQVVGIDCSPNSIEAARRLAKLNDVEGACDFQVMDALEYLRSTKLAFDTIFVRESLYYLDLDQTLPLIVEHLKPGGSFICIETNGSNFMMNGIRRLRNQFKGHRDTRTLDSLLRRRAFSEIANYFDASEIRFFDCLSLGFVLFSWNKSLCKFFHETARKLDYFLLNVLGSARLPFLGCFAFKVVFRGSVLSEGQPRG